MGFRFRKSLNLGCGFRINLSKSGIGYSWGSKGFRVTKTATGRTRTTASIPGTGISYVEESSNNNQKPTASNIPSGSIDNNHLPIEYIKNANAKTLVSEGLEEIIASAERILMYNKYANYAMIGTLILSFINLIFVSTFILSIIAKLYVKKKGVIDLNYIIEPEQLENIEERMAPILKIMESEKVWRITETSKVIDRKYASGASDSIKREVCMTRTIPPFPFKANVLAPTFCTGNESLVFLPDKLFIIQGTDIGVLDYKDLISSSSRTRFIEEEGVPKDAIVVGTTWKYVNKSGGPDKRFKGNKELPICSYGELNLSSYGGLNTRIMFSKCFE